jgi:hypothetical protein
VLVCCAAFIAANLLVPLTLGDVYPFTVAPMFRDAPRRYCNYRVFAPDGTVLADNSTRRGDPLSKPDPFLLRRYYDGNPVGFGVGVRPPVTLGDFGPVHDEAEIRSHFARVWPAEMTHAYVVVEQEIVGPLTGGRVGILETRRFRVERPLATDSAATVSGTTSAAKASP